jgi:hypothetical protein
MTLPVPAEVKALLALIRANRLNLEPWFRHFDPHSYGVVTSPDFERAMVSVGLAVINLPLPVTCDDAALPVHGAAAVHAALTPPALDALVHALRGRHSDASDGSSGRDGGGGTAAGLVDYRALISLVSAVTPPSSHSLPSSFAVTTAAFGSGTAGLPFSTGSAFAPPAPPRASPSSSVPTPLSASSHNAAASGVVVGTYGGTRGGTHHGAAAQHRSSAKADGEQGSGGSGGGTAVPTAVGSATRGVGAGPARGRTLVTRPRVVPPRPPSADTLRKTFEHELGEVLFRRPAVYSRLRQELEAARPSGSSRSRGGVGGVGDSDEPLVSTSTLVARLRAVGVACSPSTVTLTLLHLGGKPSQRSIAVRVAVDGVVDGAAALPGSSASSVRSDDGRAAATVVAVPDAVLPLHAVCSFLARLRLDAAAAHTPAARSRSQPPRQPRPRSATPQVCTVALAGWAVAPPIAIVVDGCLAWRGAGKAWRV